MSITIPQIISARHLLGWSQADLAARLNVSHGRVSEWERKKDVRPERTEVIINVMRDEGIRFMDLGEYIGVLAPTNRIRKVGDK
jgi:transcriptional regulator with XRE-family HTH domain